MFLPCFKRAAACHGLLGTFSLYRGWIWPGYIAWIVARYGLDIMGGSHNLHEYPLKENIERLPRPHLQQVFRAKKTVSSKLFDGACLHPMPADQGNRPYEWDSIPGPGAYSTTSNQKGEGTLGDAPSFSMVGRNVSPRSATASPGPVYSPRSKGQMGDGSQYTFGMGRDQSLPRKTPGPGDYETHTNAKGASSLGDQPKYGFGTSTQRETHSARGNRCVLMNPQHHQYFSSHLGLARL